MPDRPEPSSAPLDRRGWLTGGAGRVLLTLLGLALVCLGALRALREVASVPVPTAANTRSDLGADFRDATYFPVKQFLAGGQPYDPSAMLSDWPVKQEFGLYAPYHLALYSPLSLLDYQSAFLVFALLAIGFILATCVLGARFYRLPGGWPVAVVVAGIVLNAQFSKWVLWAGQILPQVAFGATVALLMAGRNPVLSGIGILLAFTKPQFGVPLVLLMLARRCWREVAWGVGLTALASLPVLVPVVLRAGGVLAFVDLARANLAYSAGADYSRITSMARADLPSLVSRVTGLSPGWLEPVVAVVILGGTALLLAVRVLDAPARVRAGWPMPFGPAEILLVTVAMRLSVYHMIHEGVLHVAAVIGVSAAWLYGRVLRDVDPPLDRWSGPGTVAAVVAGALVLLPGLQVTRVDDALVASLGEAGAALIEPIGLVLAFAILVVLVFRQPVSEPARAPASD